MIVIRVLEATLISLSTLANLLLDILLDMDNLFMLLWVLVGVDEFLWGIL